MKYIRTKDGRILVVDDNSPMAKLTTNKVADTIDGLIQEGDLIKVNNSIVEVVHVYKATHPSQMVYRDEMGFSYTIKNVKAIFVLDKKGNYIKVAERNEKGKLKLL